MFWLRLLGNYQYGDEASLLAAPADVALIWLAHLSHPQGYESDLKRGMSAKWQHPRGLAPQYRRLSRAKDTVTTSFTEGDWNTNFGKSEPWDAHAAAALAPSRTAVGVLHERSLA